MAIEYSETTDSWVAFLNKELRAIQGSEQFLNLTQAENTTNNESTENSEDTTAWGSRPIDTIANLDDRNKLWWSERWEWSKHKEIMDYVNNLTDSQEIENAIQTRINTINTDKFWLEDRCLLAYELWKIDQLSYTQVENILTNIGNQLIRSVNWEKSTKENLWIPNEKMAFFKKIVEWINKILWTTTTATIKNSFKDFMDRDVYRNQNYVKKKQENPEIKDLSNPQLKSMYNLLEQLNTFVKWPRAFNVETNIFYKMAAAEIENQKKNALQKG